MFECGDAFIVPRGNEPLVDCHLQPRKGRGRFPNDPYLTSSLLFSYLLWVTRHLLIYILYIIRILNTWHEFSFLLVTKNIYLDKSIMVAKKRETTNEFALSRVINPVKRFICCVDIMGIHLTIFLGLNKKNLFCVWESKNPDPRLNKAINVPCFPLSI